MHDIEITGAIGLQGDRCVFDVDVIDPVQLGATLPVVVVRLEGPLLVFLDARNLERPVADVIFRRLPPVIGIFLSNFLLHRVKDPRVGDGVIVGRGVGEIESATSDHRAP